MKKLQLLLSHLNIVFGTVFLVLVILNKFNSGMQFLSSPVTRWFLLLFSLCGVVLGIVSVALHRRTLRARMAKSRMNQRPYVR